MTLGKSDGTEIVQAASYDEICQIQIDAIRAQAKELGRPLSILEAGCGQCWTLDLAGTEYTLTGVDLDVVALELRKTQARDLNVAIAGDICSVDLPEASFDIVYSAFVLEHVPRADAALSNFVRWLKPGGLLILHLPERRTARGFLTRMLPHGAHVFFRRHIYGSKTAGQPGYPPYPTHYHPVIARDELCEFLAERDVKCVGVYADGFRREGAGLTRMMVRSVVVFTSLLSFGHLTADYINLMYVAVKGPQTRNGSE
jgi:2-polyprenyl-3-methyl-5-hydroxy-6-metoxy-1,4-benzoquinol methylase